MSKKISVVSDSEKFSAPEVITPAKPQVIPDTPISESLPDNEIEEVFQRAAEIDELTAQFICDLMGIDGEMAFSIKEVIDAETLESIEDEFECVLAQHGIFIHRPTIVEDDDGKEMVVSSIYQGDV